MPQHDPETDAAREDLCRFLAACYYEPDPMFAEERLFDSMLDAARRLDPGLAECARKLGEAFAAADVQTLRLDYTRLFLGPGQPLARPYGSYWLGGETAVMQDSTMAVQALYQEGGFELDEEFPELPDHVAVELEFLYLLTLKRNAACRAGLSEVEAAWEHLRGLFLREHLGLWISRFTAAVEAAAETAFYRELAGMTERFLRREMAGQAAP